MALALGPNSLEVNGNHRKQCDVQNLSSVASSFFGLLSHVPCRAKWPKWWTPPWPPPATLGRPLGYKLSSRRLG